MILHVKQENRSSNKLEKKIVILHIKRATTEEKNLRYSSNLLCS